MVAGFSHLQKQQRVTWVSAATTLLPVLALLLVPDP
jgi:hypothetical protein